MPGAGRKIRRRALGCGLIVAILAAVVWLSWPRERLLLEMARPVCPIDTSPFMNNPKEAVYWLTSKLLLIITTEHDSYLADNGNGINDWKGHAELFDTGKRTRTRLNGLTNLLNRRGVSRGSHPYDFKLSPTGTRLYWSAFLVHRMVAGNSIEYRAAVATLEGSELQEWPTEEDQPSFWTDEQHFVEVTCDRKDQLSLLRIHDARNSRGDRIIQPYLPETSSLLAPYDEDHPLTTKIATKFDYSGFIEPLRITRRWFDVKTGKIMNHADIVSWPTNTRMPWSFSLPKSGSGSFDETSVTNPAFFDLQRSETPRLMECLHRIIPAVSIKPVLTEGLWVSRAGVQEMQEIGHIPVHTDKDNNIVSEQLEQVETLPDGKQISFIYRGTLYVAPIQTSK